MGEAAYREAEKNGELMSQRLREEARQGAELGGHPEYELLVSEAADLIDWLNKERDRLIADLERASTEGERLRKRLSDIQSTLQLASYDKAARRIVLDDNEYQRLIDSASGSQS
jgi:hypothetical protein